MARSLEGKWFHTCYNNGVEAIVSNAVLKNRKKEIAIIIALERMAEGNSGRHDLLPHIPKTPVFTFASMDRVKKSPWFTGTNSNGVEYPSDLQRLLNYIPKNGGYFGTANFRVPFSNGNETGLHGPEAQLEELRYVTTDAQFVETFGISLEELRDSGSKYT